MKPLHLVLSLLILTVFASSCFTETNREEEVTVSTVPDSSVVEEKVPTESKTEPATTKDADSESTDAKPSLNAGAFLEKAIRSHQQDIHIAGLAESKGTNADIKNLARALRTDHQQLLDELKSIHGSGATGPALGKDAAELEKLKEVSFDEAWKRSMLRQQENLINTYTIQLGKVNDPVLQAHLNKAISILRSNRQKMEEFISK